eukprot:scaffold23069_cov36-Tisochrysis_lutea.AAC.1
MSRRPMKASRPKDRIQEHKGRKGAHLEQTRLRLRGAQHPRSIERNEREGSDAAGKLVVK